MLKRSAENSIDLFKIFVSKLYREKFDFLLAFSTMALTVGNRFPSLVPTLVVPLSGNKTKSNHQESVINNFHIFSHHNKICEAFLDNHPFTPPPPPSMTHEQHWNTTVIPLHSLSTPCRSVCGKIIRTILPRATTGTINQQSNHHCVPSSSSSRVRAIASLIRRPRPE